MSTKCGRSATSGVISEVLIRVKWPPFSASQRRALVMAFSIALLKITALVLGFHV